MTAGTLNGPAGAPMHGWAAPKMPIVRIGVVGVGLRGGQVIERVGRIDGVEVVAVCDKAPEKIARAQKTLADTGRPKAREYLGDDGWRELCEDPDVDVVYNATPWSMHVPVALCAMRCGKHVFTEVPSAFTVDECWELVETSESMKRHCMQLENCCYDEIALLEFHLAKLGMLGELVHGEGAYIHDLRLLCKREWPDVECWRFAEYAAHGGNRYPTHGLVPLCLTMDVNRGDRLDYLVSLESNQSNFKAYMEANLAAGNPRRSTRVRMADMNTTLIKTALGRSLLIQHDVSTPRPYTRKDFLSGTKGAICGFPYRVVLEDSPGSGAHAWFDEKRAEEVRTKYRHPLWKTMGEISRRIGDDHGGIDFIMDARWIYCLQQGLPLDMDVYDLASSCCLCELTEKSADNRSRPYDIPDFTRGAWRSSRPMGIIDIDLAKFTVKS